MAGAALSKLWGTNPKLACVLQSLACLMLGLFLAALLFERNNSAATVIIGVGFVIETGTLIWFTRDAMQDGWARSDY